MVTNAGLVFVVGLCLGIFIGTVVISISNLVDHKRAIKVEREKMFEEFGEVVFKREV